MPTYAYRCTMCTHEFEAKQSFTDDALTICPECGGALRKLFSSVGVVFKGSGFYRTDSRAGSTSSGSRKAPAAASASSSDSGSSSSDSGSSSGSGSSATAAPAAAGSSAAKDSSAA